MWYEIWSLGQAVQVLEPEKEDTANLRNACNYLLLYKT